MSLGKSLALTLLCITFTMVVGYTVLMEASLVTGVLFNSEIRLHRTADSWIRSRSNLSNTDSPGARHQGLDKTVLPADGTPVVYRRQEFLPIDVLNQLPSTLTEGQFTVIKTDELGLLDPGYLLHLYRVLPNGEGLHVVQRLMLADHEIDRVQQFDALGYKRALFSSFLFILITLIVVLFFGRRMSGATTRLIRWCENLSIHSLPNDPPKLPFLEIQRIAAGTLATVKRERDAIENRHKFLRSASHELRTPLAIATANTELLARYGVDENAQDALTRLDDALQNMNSLTDTLLWLGRGEAPLPQAEPVDLLSLVNTVIDANRALAIKNNVLIDVIHASSNYTTQPKVLLSILCSNLVGNAIRYTRDGRVTIRLSSDTFEVENCGDQLGHKVCCGGHGLGLQLVAWVVERAGWVWNEDGGERQHKHRVQLFKS